MPEFDCDLHIHSKFARGTSERMDLPTIAEQAVYKGLSLVATGDCLHNQWLRGIKNLKEVAPGTFKHPDWPTNFILQTEVEAEKRVHHLIFLPDLEAVEKLRTKFKKYGNLESDGRPNLRLTGEDLVSLVSDVDGLIGPAHAFTPWTAMYGAFDSLEACYGSNAKEIRFLELGLSADTNMADGISELHRLTFLSNSDCHSPWPHRIGREFNRFDMAEPTFEELRKAILRQKNRPILNAGFDPREGKYHMTACTRCFRQYKWPAPSRCGCGGLIKRGVSDRVRELSDASHGPKHRPPYIHIIPLAQIISKALGIKTLTSGKIQDSWKKLIDAFGTEIQVLVDVPIEKIETVAGAPIASAIDAFRQGHVKWQPGGGGKYGEPTIEGIRKEGQKSLSGF